jgi:hypothetical protein
MWYVLGLKHLITSHTLSSHRCTLGLPSTIFNPIEEAFSAIKASLQRNEHYFTGPEQIPYLVSLAVAEITEEDARGWFADCGYL